MPGSGGRFLAVLLSLCLGTAVAAQDSFRAPPPILTLDQERLFADSRAAEQISAEIEAAAGRLAEENRRIEAELTAEELDLTEKRPTMDPDDFRALADAFDVKVQRLRDEQDAKALELQRRRDQDRQTFLRQITPILAEIARERGAVVLLDRRSVILSADSIDITDEAVARINEAFEEGTQTPVPADGAAEPGAAPEANVPAAPDDGMSAPAPSPDGATGTQP